jgi:Flp pilus assembly protein TadB
MGIWILLTVLSGVAMYFAISIGRPILIAATAFAAGLGIVMMVLRVLMVRNLKREMGHR